MRIKFALGTPVYDECTVVIVLHVAYRTIGMVVDAVSDVLTLEPSQMRPVPELDASLATAHLMAVGSVGERMLLLVDIAQLMQSPEMGLFRLRAAAEANAALH
jgi:purine-binding chemotaxis protein CheW